MDDDGCLEKVTVELLLQSVLINHYFMLTHVSKASNITLNAYRWLHRARRARLALHFGALLLNSSPAWRRILSVLLFE